MADGNAPRGRARKRPYDRESPGRDEGPPRRPGERPHPPYSSYPSGARGPPSQSGHPSSSYSSPYQSSGPPSQRSPYGGPTSRNGNGASGSNGRYDRHERAGPSHATATSSSLGSPPAPSGYGGAPPARQSSNEIAIPPGTAGFSKKGKAGHPIQLLVNYFLVKPLQEWKLFQYRVDFTPDIEHVTVRKALLYKHEDKLGSMLFDGSTIFIPKILPVNLELVSALKSDNSIVTMSVKRVGEVDSSDHHYQQVLNLILRRCLEKLKLVIWNRNYYDKDAAEQISQYRLTVWPGYVTSVRHHENSLMLCCEIAHRVLREERASDVLARSLRNGQDAALAALLGEIVMTRYNNKTYRVDDIDWTKTPADTFELRKEKRMVSYAEYYQERYNLVTRDMRQPMLISKPKEKSRNRGDNQPVYLIPEHAYMTGLSEEMRKDFNTMKTVGSVTRLDPPSRIRALQKFSQRLTANPAVVDHLRKWGLQLGRDMERVQGRVLEPERIIFGNGTEFRGNRTADWSREMRGKTFLGTMNLIKFAIVYPRAMERDLNEFLGSLSRVANMGLNFDVRYAARFALERDVVQAYVQELTHVVEREPEFVLVLLRSQRADMYAAIKKLLTCENAIPNQVITQRILKKGLSVATKVYIQMACKMGCEAWRVQIPMQNAMAIGFDTYHDKGQKRSVGAFVASINQAMTRYCSTAMLHSNNEELCSKIGICMRKSLQEYQKANGGAVPDKIFYYRDGVGTGDIQYLKMQEIAQLREAFRATHPDYNPKLVVVLVSKRINTRIMRESAHEGNPEPGTIVDDVITLPDRYDFFLVSQYVTQGTVSPTAYNVIEDTLGLPPDRVQQLTYKLTHLYYNWQGTLRVPAPCHYAHKLAYLVGEALHTETHQGLSCLPFYL